MVDIREMAPDEVEAMIPLARKFFAEGNLPGNFAPDHFVDNWRNWIEAGVGVVFSAWRGFDLLGFLGGIRLVSPTTAEMELHEMFWFMDPDERIGTAGLRLLKAFEEEGQRIGAARVTMVHLCNDTGSRVAKLIERRGFQPLEVHYAKEL